MAKEIVVKKPEAMQNLIGMIDFYGKRIKKSKSENIRTLLAGRLEGAMEAFEGVGIVTETDKAILKQYFENKYGKEA